MYTKYVQDESKEPTPRSIHQGLDGDIDFAKKFFKTDHINLEIQEAMDWDTLELWDTALLGEDGKQIYADVLYRVFTKDQQEIGRAHV